MSRSDTRGPKLPRILLDQVGGSRKEQGKYGNQKIVSQHPRHDRRKAQRTERKQVYPRSLSHGPPTRVDTNHGRPNEGDESDSVEQPSPPRSAKAAKQASKSKLHPAESENGSSSAKKEATRPIVSRAVKERLAEDDAEIAALEKRLGMKHNETSSKGLQEDGLDFLLDTLGDSRANVKRPREEYDEYLQSKRRKSTTENQLSHHKRGYNSSSDEEIQFEDDSESASDGDLHEQATDDDELTTDEDDDQASAFDGLESEESFHEASNTKRQRENPYVAPVADGDTGVGKYVPPSLRQASGSDADDLARLKRQVQGLLNRLSEANITTIVRDIERLYQSNPRQFVTTSVVELLLNSLADRTRLNDTFIVLHAGFAAGLYKTVGPDFGALFIERIVNEFDNAYELECQQHDSKAAANLISLISTLYIFQVIAATMIFDYVRILLRTVSETNTELLLLIVRSCGTQLRQDDPSSLKDIVTMLHAAVVEAGESQLSVRTKFMVETVNNLKNNRAKAGATASAAVGEHITRLKKAIGMLPSRKAAEPFRLSLADIRNADKKGKWWLVGASWKGEERHGLQKPSNAATAVDGEPEMLDDATEDPDGEADLVVLAKHMGMNTEIRRAIFISIMSATDIKDAQLRLMKLHLKKAQEVEIPRVLIKCAGAEQVYNQYYTLVAQHLCSQDHRLQKAFQFSLWDLFRRMGEKSDQASDMDDDDDDDDDDSTEQAISLRQLVNYGKMFGTLIRKGALSITSLKVLHFGILRSKATAFLEVVFATIFQSIAAHPKPERRQSSISKIFEDARLAPAMIPGQQRFLEDLLRGNALDGGEDAKAVRKSCREAILVLRGLAEG